MLDKNVWKTLPTMFFKGVLMELRQIENLLLSSITNGLMPNGTVTAKISWSSYYLTKCKLSHRWLKLFKNITFFTFLLQFTKFSNPNIFLKFHLFPTGKFHKNVKSLVYLDKHSWRLTNNPHRWRRQWQNKFPRILSRVDLNLKKQTTFPCMARLRPESIWNRILPE